MVTPVQRSQGNEIHRDIYQYIPANFIFPFRTCVWIVYVLGTIPKGFSERVKEGVRHAVILFHDLGRYERQKKTAAGSALNFHHLMLTGISCSSGPLIKIHLESTGFEASFL